MFESAVQKQHILHDHSKAEKLKNQLARLEKMLCIWPSGVVSQDKSCV